MGLARLLQGNRSSVIFPHHSPLHFKRSPPPADGTVRCAGSSSTTLVLLAERAAVLLAKRESSPHAGNGPLDTAVQHARFIPRQKGRLKQLVIIQGINLGVAELGEPRRHRAVKLLQRSACTAPPLSWNQGGPSCFRLCAAFLPKTVRSRPASLCSRFSTSGKMRRP